MAQTQLLKRRIRSISSTKQITKAMELVAATKMRRVQEAAHKARIYSDATITALRNLSTNAEVKLNPYFKPSAAKAKLYVIFNSDRGLAGAYNSNIFATAAKAFIEDRQAGWQPMVVAFGRKGARYFARITDIQLLGEYENVPDIPSTNVFAPVIETIDHGIKNNLFNSISLLYTEPVSALTQRVRTLDLVPVRPSAKIVEDERPSNIVYELEPDAEVVLASAIKLYLESSLYRARVESAASEHAMRMVSMNSATRNANELTDELTLELNATRQAAITQEMAEIIGGAGDIA